MPVCVHLPVCVHVCEGACLCVHVYKGACLCVHVHAYKVLVCVCARIRGCLPVCTHMCEGVCMCTHTRVGVCVCVHVCEVALCWACPIPLATWAAVSPGDWDPHPDLSRLGIASVCGSGGWRERESAKSL